MAHTTEITIGGVAQTVTEFDSTAQEIDDAVAAIPSLTAAIAAVIPSGLISLWSGAADKVPAGWLLCDGTNGTPDLRGRFVVGAGGSYSPGDKGGSNTVTLTAEQMPGHTHDFTGSAHTHKGTINMTSLEVSEAGGHTHKIDKFYQGYYGSAWYYLTEADGAGSGSSYVARLTQYSSSGGKYFTNSDDTEGTHTHTVTGNGTVEIDSATVGGTNAQTGGGQAHENRPPYYALCYIMKE